MGVGGEVRLVGPPVGRRTQEGGESQCEGRHKKTGADSDDDLDDIPGYREDLQAHAATMQCLLVGGRALGHGFNLPKPGTNLPTWKAYSA